MKRIALALAALGARRRLDLLPLGIPQIPRIAGAGTFVVTGGRLGSGSILSSGL
jgi:hypothetical protein